MKKSKSICLIIVMFLLVIIVLIVIKNNKKYSFDKSIIEYEIKNEKIKKEYLDYIKGYIKPDKLKKFIDYDYVNLYGYNNSANGKEALREMEVEGYLSLFNSLFDKNRVDFEDCPVTNGFKEKFRENLLKHFNLIESDDSIGICMFDYDENDIELNVYSNFENTEPTSVNTYHFHYTLDSEGNVDDVILDNTSE